MYVSMTRCISMPTSLNGTECMNTVIARLYNMFYMDFRGRCINIENNLLTSNLNQVCVFKCKQIS
jgi:disulfide oxidoreductase YuzD